MSERRCAMCGRNIAREECPLTFTGSLREDLDTGPGEPALICEDCYEDCDTSRASSF